MKLGDVNAVANVAVKDLAVAKMFYAGTLGLEQVHDEDGEVAVYRSGSSMLNVYRSEYAGTNKATAVTWEVGDAIDDMARELKAKGIVFERYDMPGLTLEGDLYSGHGMKVGWFKDPDGNILNIIKSSADS
jgi:catechol 2,3-dioxygenase-like lactoylglutathione lyase family enzyme